MTTKCSPYVCAGKFSSHLSLNRTCSAGGPIIDFFVICVYLQHQKCCLNISICDRLISQQWLSYLVSDEKSRYRLSVFGRRNTFEVMLLTNKDSATRRHHQSEMTSPIKISISVSCFYSADTFRLYLTVYELFAL